MSHDKVLPRDAAHASLTRQGGAHEESKALGYYTVECVGPDGKVKWVDIAWNLVTTVGKNEALNQFLAGSSYTTVIYMGLKGTGSANVADTMSSHAGWSEVGGSNAPAYTGNRATPPFVNAASSGTKTQSTASSFAITSAGTVDGCFMVVNSGASATKDNTGGILFSAGTFASGSRAVDNGDTLNVTYSLSLT